MKQTCLVLIDGSNFYFKLKELGIKNILNFDISKLITTLAEKRKITETIYYVGKIRQDGTAKTDKLLDAQQKLLTILRNQRIKYKLGYLLKNKDKFHEKGVDVQIAVDIVVAAYEKLANRIILISSDTDLAPAIKIARKKGLVIEYIGFKHKPSIAMKRFCDKTRLLTKEDLEQFLPE